MRDSQHSSHRTVCSGAGEGPPAPLLVSGPEGDAYSIATQVLAAGINALDKEDQLFNQHLHTDRPLPALTACDSRTASSPHLETRFPAYLK